MENGPGGAGNHLVICHLLTSHFVEGSEPLFPIKWAGNEPGSLPHRTIMMIKWKHWDYLLCSVLPLLHLH